MRIERVFLSFRGAVATRVALCIAVDRWIKQGKSLLLYNRGHFVANLWPDDMTSEDRKQLDDPEWKALEDKGESQNEQAGPELMGDE